MKVKTYTPGTLNSIIDDFSEIAANEESEIASDDGDIIELKMESSTVCLTPDRCKVDVRTESVEHSYTISPVEEVKLRKEELDYTEGERKTHYGEPVKVKIDAESHDLRNLFFVVEGVGETSLTIRNLDERKVRTYRWE